MRPTSKILLAATVLCLPALACDYEASGMFRLDGHDGDTRTWIVPDQENVGAGPAMLGGVAGTVFEARYALGSERSAYLFEGNLAAGIIDEPFAALPPYDPSSSDLEEDGSVLWMVVESDRPDYESFRVYDSGSCSLTIGWNDSFLPDLVPTFADAVASAVDTRLARCEESSAEQFRRTSPASIIPEYRARAGGGAGALGIDDDVFRYSATYQAGSVGGCEPTNVDIAFSAGFRRGPEGELVGYVDEQTVYVEVQNFCIAEDQIENGIRDSLIEALPGALVSAINDGTRVTPGTLGQAAMSCDEHAECDAAYPGNGHQCVENECMLQLGVRRVNVRPEGVELVLTETDDDGQRPLLASSAVIEAFVCGEERNNGMLLRDFTNGMLESFEVDEPDDDTPTCP